MLAIGYPKEEPSKKRPRKPINKILFSEKLGKSF